MEAILVALIIALGIALVYALWKYAELKGEV